MSIVKNASQKPKRYFGLHFVKGLAEYRDQKINNGEPYKIFVDDDAINKMHKSFEGCPVYVHHVDSVNMPTLETDADGFVVKSFFNKSDGNHWVEFIVTTDRGHEAIQKRWALSNAYFMLEPVGSGGQWHAIKYEQEVLNGEFEHLAIVPDPRYQESKEVGILTPEEFKAYNAKKDSELTLLQNSKNNEKAGDKEMSIFKIFKKNAIEDKDQKEMQGLVIQLPKSKVEVELSKLVNEADEKELKKDEKQYANEKHMVKMNEDGSEEMSVEELKAKYNEMKKSAMSDEDALEELEDLVEHEVEEVANEDDKDDKEKEKEKKENALKEKKEKEAERFRELSNSRKKANSQEAEIYMSSADKVTLGKQLF